MTTKDAKKKKIIKKTAAKKINGIRGMRDILHDEIPYWQFIEKNVRSLTKSYAYTEIRLPLVESTELFKRSVGTNTDIVEKEMYTFSDLNGDSLTLRPEGTAGVVRTGIEHSLFYGETPKVWYLGPMFRHERPQKGRYRQFYQFGMEAFGVSSAHVDAEILAFCQRLWQVLGIDHKVKLQVNCLGTKEVRAAYNTALVSYFQDNFDSLDQDSKNRLQRSPLRILDSKNPDLKDLINQAPKLTDFLDDVSQNHMQELYKSLECLNIKYEVNPHLVRGLDYYSLTVFEWVTDELGAQGTICAGGRYDSLVSDIGGQETPAVGMSMGVERVVLMLQQLGAEKLSEAIKTDNQLDIFMILCGSDAQTVGLNLAEDIRTQLPLIKLNTNTAAQSLKSQFKKADKSGAKLAIVIGDDEIENKLYSIKWLRDKNKIQQQLTFEELIDCLKEI